MVSIENNVQTNSNGAFINKEAETNKAAVLLFKMNGVIIQNQQNGKVMIQVVRI